MKRAKTQKSDTGLGERLRVLLMDYPDYSIDEQRKHVAALGLGKGVEYVNDLPGWLAAMRPTDTAAVPTLHVLAPPPGTPRPTVAFDRNVHTLMASRAIVIEAATATASTDPASFAERIKLVRDHIRSGRHMTPRAARKRGKLGAAKRQKPLTAAARWALVPTKIRELAEAVWLTRGGNDDTALDKMNALLAKLGRASDQFGSPATVRRVIGKRTGKRG